MIGEKKKGRSKSRMVSSEWMCNDLKGIHFLENSIILVHTQKKVSLLFISEIGEERGQTKGLYEYE